MPTLRLPAREWTGTRYGRAALESEVSTLAHVDHQRVLKLFAASCRMGNLVAGDELSEAHATHTLVRVGQQFELKNPEVLRTVRNGIKRGMTTPRVAPSDATAIRHAADARVAAYGWSTRCVAQLPTGRSRAGMVRLVLAIRDVAMEVGKVKLHESTRTLAERCGLSHVTVGKYLRALEESGWIRRGHDPGRWRGECRSLRLNLKRGVSKSSMPEASPSGRDGLEEFETPLRSSTENTWHHASAGWLVWEVLANADEALSAPELVQRTGISRATVYRYLKRWLKEGNVTCDEDGYCATSVPFAEGVVDYRAEQRARHRREREQYRSARRAIFDRVGLTDLREARRARAERQAATQRLIERFRAAKEQAQ